MTEQTSSKSPSHIAYQVRDRKEQTGIWTRIGAAWPQKDRQGIQHPTRRRTTGWSNHPSYRTDKKD